jgi:hypothetical protein
MLRAQAERAAVSGLHVGGGLVGSWTLDLKPRAERNVVPSGPGAQSLELNPIDPTGRETLTLVWIWRPAFPTRYFTVAGQLRTTE